MKKWQLQWSIILLAAWLTACNQDGSAPAETSTPAPKTPATVVTPAPETPLTCVMSSDGSQIFCTGANAPDGQTITIDTNAQFGPGIQAYFATPSDNVFISEQGHSIGVCLFATINGANVGPYCGKELDLQNNTIVIVPNNEGF